MDSRLGSCEVCSDNQAKYSCPKCEVKSCSLACSKIHKSEMECDGIRDRTKYKPLKQMTPMDFMNDYYFLEEATRFTKDIKTNTKIRNNNKLHLRFVKLKKEAMNRNVKLYLLNNGLTKRKRNQSVFKAKENSIYWFVEMIFPNANNLTLFRKISEHTKISDLVESVITTEASEQQIKQLEFYRAEGGNKLRVLLKAEGLKNSKNRYHELNLKKSLKANLSGKVVIEYPTLFVVMNHSVDGFELVPSDDEEVEIEMKNFKKTLYEEVFSKKVGLNPPLILKPEEVPIISEVIDDSGREKEIPQPEIKSEIKNESCSDDEIQPENYFF